ncbi:cilia- and flagella-associated protein 70 isoform X1 [Apus apus]|uniref:cilia- and flagella-associated protein 70 isoform X1 n=1 Tax=Apus apus TaxID=8895 RepID=UPI0021F8A047|nr:cilia- and flagella-associated protein 70 isoform X1 [Apus apus]
MAQDLRSLKSDLHVTSVHVEYNGAILGDSSRVDVLPDGTANYNFTTSFECHPDGPNSLDDIAQKPVLLTVIEVLQKEKKKKEKTVPLGQAVVDLLPLLQGQGSFQVFAPLYAVPASPSESLHPEAKGGLEVTVCSQEPLVPAEQLSHSNLLSVTLEAAYSVPEAFAPAGPLQSYMVCLQVPAAGEREALLLFKDGVLKPAGEKEPLPRPKKWPLSNIMAPAALNIPNSFIIGGPYEDEDGELNKREDREFRMQAETSRRIIWDMERRCYLDPAAAATLQQRVAESQSWPVEICRMALPSASKGKTSKADKGDEDKQIFFHGVAYVNMLPLLCPGVRQIRGAFPVCTYQDREVLLKTKSQHSVLRDLRRKLSQNKEGPWAPGLGTPLSSALSHTQREDKINKERDSSRRMSGTSLILSSDATGEAENATQHSPDGQYFEAGTFLLLEIKLDKALVPKRTREELSDRVKEMIPPRPLLPPRTSGAKKAVEGYHNCVRNLAVAILREYQELFGKQLPEWGAIEPPNLEEQKLQLSCELASSGKKLVYKEQLQYAVVKIVREKYLKTMAFETQEQLQEFLCELNVYLMDQMHIDLNQLLSQEAVSPSPPTPLTEEQLCLFAQEAELDKDYELANFYHQQRLSQDQHNIQSWLDYGVFNLLLEDPTKAQECFQQALFLDPHHIQSLLLCATVAAMLQHYEEAETFFEMACSLEPPSTVAWTLSGLFYELQDDSIRAEMAFREARKLLQAQLDKEKGIPEGEGGEEHVSAGSVGSPSPDPAENPPAPSPASGPGQPPCTIFMKAVEFLQKVNAIQFLHQALAHELLNFEEGPSCAYYLALAHASLLKEDFSKCEECLREAVGIDYTNPNVWAQKGHLCYLREEFPEAKLCYEQTLSFLEDAVDMHWVCLRLGSIYLQEKQYGRAKQTYLLACKDSASCLTWLGVGISCYRLHELAEAEDALTEANALNNTNAEVWGYLALVCLQAGREREAEQCYKYTVKLGLKDEALLREIRAVHQRLGFGNPAL